MASRFALVLSVFTLLASSVSVGQESKETKDKIQMYIGYSILHLDTGGLNRTALDTAFRARPGSFGSPSRFSGGEGQLQFNITRRWGVAADLSGNFGKPFPVTLASGITGLPREQAYSLLLGPVLSFASGKVVPFVHGLFGVDRLAIKSANALTGLTINSLSSASDTAFGMAFGAGLDLHINSIIGVRLGQIDYLYANHDMNTFAGKIFRTGTFVGLASHENDFRASGGITARF